MSKEPSLSFNDWLKEVVLFVKITPTAHHLNQLIEALLVSYNYSELAQLTRIELDENLQWITPVQGQRDLRTVVSDLVIYYASIDNGLRRLSVAALARNPNNSKLVALEAEWFDLDFERIELPQEHPALTAYVKSASNRFWMIFIALVLLIALGTLTALDTSIVRSFIPSATPMRGRLFNIAVAEIIVVGGDAGENNASEFVRKEASIIQEELAKGFDAHESFSAADVEVRPIMLGIAGEEQAEQRLQRWASENEADIVIYGVLNLNTNPYAFRPRFYVEPELAGAQEITGIDAFGQTIYVDPPLAGNALSRTKFRAEMDPRIQALTEFMVGLALFKGEFYDEALKQFELANQAENWSDGADDQGRAIVSLWIGSTYYRLALQGKDSESFRCIVEDGATDAWSCTQAAYELAKTQDANFARAYIGLGNYWLDYYSARPEEKAIPGFDASCSYFELAAREYVLAAERVELMDGEEAAYVRSAYVPWKIDYNLGLAYSRAARYLPKNSNDHCNVIPVEETRNDEDDNASLAIRHFNKVLDEYKSSDPGYRQLAMARDLAARSALELAIIHAYHEEFQPALDALDTVICIAIADETCSNKHEPQEAWQSIRWDAQVEKARIYTRLADNGDDKLWEAAATEYEQLIQAHEVNRYGPRRQEDEKTIAIAYLEAGQLVSRQDASDPDEIRQAIGWIQRSIDLVLTMDRAVARSLQTMPQANYAAILAVIDRLAEVDTSIDFADATALYEELFAAVSAGGDWQQPANRISAFKASTIVNELLEQPLQAQAMRDRGRKEAIEASLTFE